MTVTVMAVMMMAAVMMPATALALTRAASTTRGALPPGHTTLTIFVRVMVLVVRLLEVRTLPLHVLRRVMEG